MDRDAATKQMKSLYKKAADARTKGKRDVSNAFKAGAARLRRELLADTIRQKAFKKKEGEAAAEGAAPAAEAPAT